MNNDLEQFSEERLKELASTPEKYDHRYTCNMLNGDESRALARIALAAKQAKPVAWEVKGILCHTKEEADVFIGEPEPLYDTPQPAHTEQGGWIKCSDNLPAETEDADGGATGYLVRYENDRVPNGGFNIGVSNCVFLRTHWRGLYSHWMPLPAAPKPEIK